MFYLCEIQRRTNRSQRGNSRSDVSKKPSRVRLHSPRSSKRYADVRVRAYVRACLTSYVLQRPPRDRLHSPNETNRYADDLLQSELKTIESTLKAAITSSVHERGTVFHTAVRRGRLALVTPELRWQEEKAIYTGVGDTLSLACSASGALA